MLQVEAERRKCFSRDFEAAPDLCLCLSRFHRDRICMHSQAITFRDTIMMASTGMFGAKDMIIESCTTEATMAHGPRFSLYVSRFISPGAWPRRAGLKDTSFGFFPTEVEQLPWGSGQSWWCSASTRRPPVARSLAVAWALSREALAECRAVKGHCVRGSPS